MKQICINFLIAFLMSYATIAFGIKTTDSKLKANAQQWMREQPVRFIENNGQMADINGKPVAFVLFKAEAPGVNLFITEQGLTIQILKVEEEHEKEKRHSSQWKGNEVETEEKNIEIKWERVDVVLKGACIKKENILKEGAGEADFNFFYQHCPDGIYGVKEYEKLTIKDIYAGIDWVFYNSSEKGFKYDFVVNPGADYKQIELLYRSNKPIKINSAGEIEVTTKHGDITEKAPVSFLNGKDIPTQFKQNYQKRIKISGDNGFETSVSFHFNSIVNNQQLALFIDPQLVWGTFYGGNKDEGFNSIDCDNSGNVYVAAYTSSTNNFPTQISGGAYFSGVSSGNFDAVLLKFSNAGVLLWATHYGGSDFDIFGSINVLPNGDFFVAGGSESPNFPTWALGGAYFNNVNAGSRDVVILKFSSTGVRIWATYYGGPGWDQGYCLTTDPVGNVYVTGVSSGLAFPTQSWVGAFNNNNSNAGYDAFILKFNNAGNRLWATCYGGPQNDFGCSISCDSNGNIYVTGNAESGFPTQVGIGAFSTAYYDGTLGGSEDAFALRFSNTGVLDWATFLGGTQRDHGHTLITTSTNGIYILGSTNGAFPVQPGTGLFTGAYYDGTYGGVTDAFIVHFSNTGLLDWSTYYGGTALESFSFVYASFDDLELDGCDNLYVTLATSSTNVNTLSPGCGSFFDGTYNGASGAPDGFIIKFSYSGVLLWASYIPSNNTNYKGSLAIDSNNNLFVGGEASVGITGYLMNPLGGAYFDNTHNGGTDDAFITKFIPILPTKSQTQVNSTTCSPCNGSSTINLTCTEPNYSYTWSNGSSTLNSASATNTISGLCPGTYTVTATSNCNQSQTATFVISGTTCGGISATVISATICSGSSPCPTLTAIGSSGTAPYTYLWNTTATTASISPCPASTTNYTVTITDKTGLTATSTAVITVSPAVNVTATPTNISCNGSANGSILATIGSGTLGYTYSWSTGPTAITNSTTQQLNNLTAGSYTVTVTDNKGCTSTSTVVIVSPPPLSGQFTKGTANCNNCGCKEWIMIAATGGTSPYTYSWPGGYNKRYKNQLCSGAYTINIKDKNGCSVNVNLSTP